MFNNFKSDFSLHIFHHQNNLAENTYLYLKKYIDDSDIILDVGSGTDKVANLIRKNFGIKVICIDIDYYHRVGTNKIIFDGINIPFKNSVFTTVLCCFVLHHALYQKKLIEEMKRVTKSKIIIMEDIPNTGIDRLVILLHKITSRINYKSKNMNFRKDHEWRNLFRNIGLIIKDEVKIKRNRELLYPVSRQLYVLSDFNK
jgi:ubiquinone/menaquinone biosynthesis C-methylase UbiE